VLDAARLPRSVMSERARAAGVEVTTLYRCERDVLRRFVGTTENGRRRLFVCFGAIRAISARCSQMLIGWLCSGLWRSCIRFRVRIVSSRRDRCHLAQPPSRTEVKRARTRPKPVDGSSSAREGCEQRKAALSDNWDFTLNPHPNAKLVEC
jgi:hypothetical protein